MCLRDIKEEIEREIKEEKERGSIREKFERTFRKWKRERMDRGGEGACN